MFRTTIILITICAVLGGCAAEGPLFSEIKDSIPALDANKTRIYFYRDASIFGAAVQPDIRLNGEVVGLSQPGSFFYTDRAPGKFEVSVATEAENKIEFPLTAGQIRYVRTYVSMGILVGRAYPELVDPSQAVSAMAGLHYIGNLGPPVASKSQSDNPGPSAANKQPSDKMATPPANPPQKSDTVNLDDLKDLLPVENVK